MLHRPEDAVLECLAGAEELWKDDPTAAVEKKDRDIEAWPKVVGSNPTAAVAKEDSTTGAKKEVPKRER